MDVGNCNINLLDNYIGKEVTYKQICKILDINYTSGSAKKRQVKYIKCYYNIEKHGTKYRIINKYDTPLEYEDKRKDKATKLTREIYDRHGVYYIVDNNKNIYIGSTSTKFGERYIGHTSKFNSVTSKDIMHTDHIFNCLYDMTNIEDDTLIKIIENEYIKYFRDNKDFNIVNSIKSTKTDPKDFKIIRIHKDKYEEAKKILKENNII